MFGVPPYGLILRLEGVFCRAKARQPRRVRDVPVVPFCPANVRAVWVNSKMDIETVPYISGAECQHRLLLFVITLRVDYAIISVTRMFNSSTPVVIPWDPGTACTSTSAVSSTA